MNSRRETLDMIATEATGDGLPRVHHFDESLNEVPSVGPDLDREREGPSLPPINYTLEVVTGPDGIPYWVE